MCVPLLRKLQPIVDLTPLDRTLIASFFEMTRTVPARSDLVNEGDEPNFNLLVMQGFLARVKRHPSGKRQVTRILVPGDVYNPHLAILGSVDHDVVSLTATTFASVSSTTCESFLAEHPQFGRAFLWARLVELSIAERWIANLGLLSAYQRLGHFLCEMYHRLEAVGLAADGSCFLPLTQEDLADILGLSTVHMNRVFQALRDDGLVAYRERTLLIPDLPRLQKAAEFCPGYLHICKPGIG